MPKRTRSPLLSSLRQCLNIKSKKHPNTRCPFNASDGEFCARHSKHPNRFQEKSPLIKPEEIIYHQIDIDSALAIQKVWKGYSLRRLIEKQGIASKELHIAQNTTDIYSLEPVETIPILYRWSYVDSTNKSWLFDIRSLNMLYEQDILKMYQNPYTRDSFNTETITNYQERIQWLLSKKYYVFHIKQEELTEDQIWHQHLLDVFLKLDMAGYYTSLNWFEDLDQYLLVKLYVELYDMWYYQLQLTNEQRANICPETEKPLFKYGAMEMNHQLRRNTPRELKWFQKIVLDLINRLLSEGKDKEHKSMGALYVMTGFAKTSPDVCRQYYWLLV
jgi:hypothetical protein